MRDALSKQSEESWSRELLAKLCGSVTKWSLGILALLLPVFVLPWTTEVADFNKQMLLFAGTGLAVLAWLGKMLAEKKFEYRRSVVNVIVLVFVGVYGLSTWLSVNPYLSLTGNFGQGRDGLLTVLALAVLYFVTINTVQTEAYLRRLLLVIVGGGALAVVLGLLQGFGVQALPFGGVSFNTVGTPSALGILAAFLVILCSGLLLYGHGRSNRSGLLAKLTAVFLVVVGILSLWLVAAIDFWPITLVLLLTSLLLIGYSFVHAGSLRSMRGIALPLAVVVVTLLGLFFNWSYGTSFPAEVMPSTRMSWDIATQTVREHPFLGSGPGTFIFDYAKYRPQEVNGTTFWNMRFDRASNRFLTLLPSVGLVGTLTWLLVALLLLGSAARKLLKSDEATWHILIGLFSTWFLLLLAKFTYSSSLTLEYLTWMMMALLVVVHKHEFYSVKFERSPRASMLVSFAFVLGLVLVLSGSFVQVQRYYGEVVFNQAIQANQKGDYVQAIEKLNSAITYNRHNDVYQRNLALSLMAQSELLSARKVTLERLSEETDEAYQERRQAAISERSKIVAGLAVGSLEAARRATEMGERNVANWSVLGQTYRKLIGLTEGAEGWALDSYQKASELEPQNPSLLTEQGKIYLLQAELIRNAAVEAGGDTTESEASAVELLDKAAEAFERSLELKPDYGPAHYNLSLTLDRLGRLDEAISRMETLARANNDDVGVGFQLSLLYFRNGQKGDAIRLLESVVRLSPDFSNARWYLAAMYEDIGEFDKAVAEIEKVRLANPESQLVERKLAELNMKAAAIVPPEEEGEELPEPVE